MFNNPSAFSYPAIHISADTLILATAYWNSKTAEEGKTQVLILQLKNRVHVGSMLSLLSALGQN